MIVTATMECTRLDAILDIPISIPDEKKIKNMILFNRRKNVAFSSYFRLDELLSDRNTSLSSLKSSTNETTGNESKKYFTDCSRDFNSSVQLSRTRGATV